MGEQPKEGFEKVLNTPNIVSKVVDYLTLLAAWVIAKRQCLRQKAKLNYTTIYGALERDVAVLKHQQASLTLAGVLRVSNPLIATKLHDLSWAPHAIDKSLGSLSKGLPTLDLLGCYRF